MFDVHTNDQLHHDVFFCPHVDLRFAQIQETASFNVFFVTITSIFTFTSVPSSRLTCELVRFHLSKVSLHVISMQLSAKTIAIFHFWRIHTHDLSPGAHSMFNCTRTLLVKPQIPATGCRSDL